VLGTKLPGPGTLYRRQVLDFHTRAVAGDEVVVRAEVLAKADGIVRLKTEVRRTADGAAILTGEAEVLAPTEKFDREGIEIPGLVVQRHRHFEALLERARPLQAMPTAVVCPDDANSLGGALLAAKESIITPILIGSEAGIRKAAEEIGADLTGIEVIDVAGDAAAAERACALVHEGRAAAVMKGHLHTDDLQSLLGLLRRTFSPRKLAGGMLQRLNPLAPAA